MKLLLQKEQTGFKLINDEIVAIDDELLEFKFITTKQHKFLLVKCLN